jgi:hypothetical protein
MNSAFRLIAKQTLQNCVILRSNQLTNLSRAAFFSSEPPKTLPQSKNPKQKTSPKITLVTGERIEVTTLDQAKKIAERRQMKLVSVIDFETKTSRAVYK